MSLRAAGLSPGPPNLAGCAAGRILATHPALPARRPAGPPVRRSATNGTAGYDSRVEYAGSGVIEMAEPEQDLEPHLLRSLEPGEAVQATARAVDGVLAVSDRRLLVATRDRIALSLPIEGLRRIEFDIEKRRPATLVIVPEEPRGEPQVLAIPPDEIRATTQALALVAERLARFSDYESGRPG
jgi:hypothetical protein